MAKSYWVASVEIHGPDGYKAFVAANAVPLAKFAGASWSVAGPARRWKGGSAGRSW